MSAFGRRNGMSGQPVRPAFGVARPMQGGAMPRAEDAAGSQFPPIDSVPLPGEVLRRRLECRPRRHPVAASSADAPGQSVVKPSARDSVSA